MSETPKALDVEAIEARAKAATPGPWGVLEAARSNLAHIEVQEGPGPQGFTVCSIPKKRIADAEFIAAAREDVPALCARVREMEALVEAAYSEGYRAGEVDAPFSSHTEVITKAWGQSAARAALAPSQPEAANG